MLTSWFVETGLSVSLDLPDVSTFVAQVRSLYVPAGDVGYWQGAIREGNTDRGDADALRDAIEAAERLTLYLRDSDQDGGHDMVTRSSLLPGENGDWIFGNARHRSVEVSDDPKCVGATRSTRRPALVETNGVSATRAGRVVGRVR